MGKCLVIHDKHIELCSFNRAAAIVRAYESGDMTEGLMMYLVDDSGEVTRMWCYMLASRDEDDLDTYIFHDVNYEKLGRGYVAKHSPAA